MPNDKWKLSSPEDDSDNIITFDDIVVDDNDTDELDFEILSNPNEPENRNDLDFDDDWDDELDDMDGYDDDWTDDYDWSDQNDEFDLSNEDVELDDDFIIHEPIDEPDVVIDDKDSDDMDWEDDSEILTEDELHAVIDEAIKNAVK